MSRIFLVSLQLMAKNINMVKRLFLSVVLIIIWVSCSSPKYVVKEVPVEVTKTEYIYQLKRDSFYIHDSVNMYIKGDTVYKDKIKCYYEKIILVDTIRTVDSIPVTITETVTTEVNVLKWYQTFFIRVGVVSLILIILYVVFKVVKWLI